ncbi:unnamed protein product [Durusdinium trenchii]|uniref:Uncharacterized protein n=1 Tax=Durusdinium trenchii TaxID=1381693 RepID=A0ABP0N202_9DINO
MPFFTLLEGTLPDRPLVTVYHYTSEMGFAKIIARFEDESGALPSPQGFAEELWDRLVEDEDGQEAYHDLEVPSESFAALLRLSDPPDCFPEREKLCRAVGRLPAGASVGNFFDQVSYCAPRRRHSAAESASGSPTEHEGLAAERFETQGPGPPASLLRHLAQQRMRRVWLEGFCALKILERRCALAHGVSVCSESDDEKLHFRSVKEAQRVAEQERPPVGATPARERLLAEAHQIGSALVDRWSRNPPSIAAIQHTGEVAFLEEYQQKLRAEDSDVETMLRRDGSW